MDLHLTGKTAVITGATQGLGRAMAEMFAAEGANVAICARNSGRVAATVAALTAQGVGAFGKALDVSDGGALQAFINEAAAALGDLFLRRVRKGSMSR